MSIFLKNESLKKFKILRLEIYFHVKKSSFKNAGSGRGDWDREYM